VVLQLCLGGITILKLRKRPLVYYGGIARVVKQAGGYPRLGGGGWNTTIREEGDGNTPRGRASLLG
jgi:hypothetical protein